MAYVDGFVLPIAKKNLPAYRRMAKKASKVWIEHGALGSIVLLLALDLFHVPAWPVALAAAALHAARLALWAPLATLRRPILWILHLSYAWVVVHLALRALARFDLMPAGLATHALTAGAIGGLTLGW